jgi:hypothetical protein
MVREGEQKTKLFIVFSLTQKSYQGNKQKEKRCGRCIHHARLQFHSFFPLNCHSSTQMGDTGNKNWNNMTVRFKQVSMTHHGKGSMGLLSIDTTELRSGGMSNLVVQVAADST